jgi:hypothetical protein
MRRCSAAGIARSFVHSTKQRLMPVQRSAWDRNRGGKRPERLRPLPGNRPDCVAFGTGTIRRTPRRRFRHGGEWRADHRDKRKNVSPSNRSGDGEVDSVTYGLPAPPWPPVCLGGTNISPVVAIQTSEKLPCSLAATEPPKRNTSRATRRVSALARAIYHRLLHHRCSQRAHQSGRLADDCAWYLA